MNVDAKFFGVVIFLLSQAVAAVIWGASLNAEVQRLSALQEKADQTASIDLVAFRLDALSGEMEKMKEMDREIVSQHERLFQMLQNSGPAQTQKGYSGYGYN